MPDDIPFYYVTLDGEDPCAWAPFGMPLSEVGRSSRHKPVASKYSNTKNFSLSILCRKHDAIANEAISQCVGCLVPIEYLRPERQDYMEAEINRFSNRLSELNTKVLPALGFEIYVVANSESPEDAMRRAMNFKNRLVLSGFDEKLIRIDIVRDQARLNEISKLRLLNIANARAAVAMLG